MAGNANANAQEETFEEQLRRYCEHKSGIHKKRFKEFEEKEAKAKAAREKALKDKAAKQKSTSKWKQMWFTLTILNIIPIFLFGGLPLRRVLKSTLLLPPIDDPLPPSVFNNM